ncbi:MAG: hypothetical protein CUN56_15700, partial [Phototrophicales bacterium]
KKGSIVAAGLFLLFAIAVALSLINQTRGREQFEEMSYFIKTPQNEARYHVTLATLDMFKDKPVWGWGANSFQYVFPDYQKDYPAIWRHPAVKNARWSWKDAHNDWVQILAEYGIVGSVLILGILVGAIYPLWRYRHYVSLTNGFWALGLCAFALHMAVDFLISAFALMIWVTAYWSILV